MPTRQYVGARYVPKFADPIAWDNANAYEALTIVTYNGTSYTSKKPVPVGTAITNTEYWVATGNYNAQVELYRQEVATLSGDVDNIEEYAEDMGAFVNNINGKHIVIIGDSTSDENINAPNWVTRLRSAVSSDTVIDNLSVNGATCANDTLASTSFIDIVSNPNNTLAGDIIILYIGTNDALQSVPIGTTFAPGSGESYGITFAGALTAIANNLRSKNVTAKVVVVSPLKLNKATPESTHINGCNFDLYRRIMQTWCKWWGFTFVDGWSAPRYFVTTSNDYCTDGVHPTSVYSPILMRWIASHVNSEIGTPVIGRCLDMSPDVGEFINEGIVLNGFSLKMTDGGIVKFRVRAGISNPSAGDQELGTIPSYITPIPNDLWFDCMANYKNTLYYNSKITITSANKIVFVPGTDLTLDGTGTLLIFVNVDWTCLASGYIPSTDQ